MADQQDPQVNLALPLSAVNYILQAIATRPYGEVKALIEEVTKQAQEHLRSQAPADDEAPAESTD
ncbi:MAG TPA: hypothetical protein VFM48_08585 [Aquabacterium sp.]|nr:hypothetical protein [Aquabacterium sp.]